MRPAVAGQNENTPCCCRQGLWWSVATAGACAGLAAWFARRPSSACMHRGAAAALKAPSRAGDSHSVALAAGGAVWAWGTFRDASGVYGFSPAERIALLPALVHAPASAADRVVKVASGAGCGPGVPQSLAGVRRAALAGPGVSPRGTSCRRLATCDLPACTRRACRAVSVGRARRG